MKKAKQIIIVFDIVIITLFFARSFILNNISKFLGECWYLKQGIICPACGGTRCVKKIFQGELIAAFFLNPAVFIVIIYIAILIISLNIAILTPLTAAKKLYNVMTKPYVIITLAILFVIVGTVRNFFPNKLL